ncbi:hypothetical protein [Bacillus sp. FJAT-45037]|uniref:hypothetical protein n=1 Tax=Bacillus sp. FJAT-45037 TaxID=2011007 RepID=UPI000C230D8B|nr:hypothetical protein [Bacillus sp. FJAT-45037]
MFKRKFEVVIFTAFVVILFLASYLSMTGEISGFFSAWYLISLFVLPGLLFYLLPVSIIAEFATRKMSNSIARGASSLLIHVLLLGLFGLWDPTLGVVAVFTAIVAFNFDVWTRKLYTLPPFKRFALPLTILISLVIIAFSVIGLINLP